MSEDLNDLETEFERASEAHSKSIKDMAVNLSGAGKARERYSKTLRRLRNAREALLDYYRNNGSEPGISPRIPLTPKYT